MASSETTWKRIRLGDLIKVEHGWPFKSSHFADNDHRRPIVVAIGNFQYTGGFRFESTAVKTYSGEYPNAYELTPGDLLLVMTCQTSGGEILGVPGRVPDDGRTYLHNQRIGKVVPRNVNDVDIGFLYYLALSPEVNRQLFASASGSKILHTSPGRIEAVEVLLPPLDNQRRIAHLLGTLDDKIELNRRMNETLEGMARALFKSWFVDFDPVRAKQQGREPSGMAPATAALFPDEFEDSELGEIPKGWSVEAIGDVVDCVGGATPSTKAPEFWEGGSHPWTTPRDFSSLSSPILTDTDRKITDAGVAQISSGVLPPGTVLLSSRAPIGYLAIAAIPVAINQGFIALRPNSRLSSGYLLNWCQSEMEQIKGRASGTTFPEISKKSFRPIRALVPTTSVMEQFDSVTAPLYRMITANLHETRSLVMLRDGLLPKLLSGELAVLDADRGSD